MLDIIYNYTHGFYSKLFLWGIKSGIAFDGTHAFRANYVSDPIDLQGKKYKYKNDFKNEKLLDKNMYV